MRRVPAEYDGVAWAAEMFLILEDLAVSRRDTNLTTGSRVRNASACQNRKMTISSPVTSISYPTVNGFSHSPFGRRRRLRL